MSVHVEWDPEKAALNVKRHGVSFEEAKEVLRDPLSKTGEDEEHSEDGEQRFKTVGHSTRGRLLVVIYAHDERGIRIVSARRPTRGETRLHEEGG